MVTLPEDMQVLVRGWVHGNCVLLRGAEPALVDSGYHTGVGALVAAFEQFTGRPIADLPHLALTHVHSDHAGGVAALQGLSQCRVHAHKDARALTEPWSRDGLWLTGTGQQLPRFTIDHTLDRYIELCGQRWQVVHTPGHATGGVALLRDDVIITGDALWEDGFGLLNPWVDGPQVLQQAELALDRILATGARVVIPGHGPPFVGLRGAVDRARSRLDYLRRSPDRLAQQLLRNCAGFLSMAHPELGDGGVQRHLSELRAMLNLPA